MPAQCEINKGEQHMGAPRTLNKTDLQDLLNGACILSSGGGGPYSLGEQIISQLKKPVKLISPEDVADDATMAIAAAVGSPDAAGKSPFPMDIAPLGFDALSQLHTAGKGFDYVLPGEVGSGNTFIPMTVAAGKGIPIVDAAGARRSVPTLTTSTYNNPKASISPIVVASPNSTVSFTAQDAARAEGPLRSIISAGFSSEFAGVAFWAMTGKVMKEVAVHNTTTYALELGKALRTALSKKQNPVNAVCKYLGGQVIIIGDLANPSENTAGGFDSGAVTITTHDKSRTVWVFNQNENLIAWDSQRDTPIAMAPDLLCYLTTDGIPFTNADLSRAKGKQVALIGAPADAALRQPAMIAAFLAVLQGLGYAGPYVPIH
jgi:DUF917 family protein